MFEENREQDERNASNQIRFRIKEKEEMKQTKKKKKHHHRRKRAIIEYSSKANSERRNGRT